MAEQPGASGPQSFELVAAVLRSDAGDVATLTRVLTTALADALPPGVVEVERSRSLGDRLAGREGTPVAVQITAPEQELSLRAGRHGPIAEIRHIVRGIVLSRRTVDIDEWTRALAAQLIALAERDAAARAALAALLGLNR